MRKRKSLANLVKKTNQRVIKKRLLREIIKIIKQGQWKT